MDLKAGDGGTVFTVTIQNQNGDTVDLNGKTVTLRYSFNGGATVEKSMTILNQTTNRGQAKYQFLSTDFTQAGEVYGEVRIDPGAGQLTTIDGFRLSVGAALPAVV